MNSLHHFNKRVLECVLNHCTRALCTDGLRGGSGIDGGFSERPRKEKCINKVTLLGRVGKDGELRGSSERPCLLFPLATSFSYRKADTGEFMVKTNWHRICVFQQGLINVASNIGKGDRILVEGSLSHERYLNDSNTYTNVTSVIADDIVFLRKRYRGADLDGGEGEDL